MIRAILLVSSLVLGFSGAIAQWQQMAAALPDSFVAYHYGSIKVKDVNPDTTRYDVGIDVHPPALPTAGSKAVSLLVPEGESVKVTITLFDMHDDTQASRDFHVPIYPNPHFDQQWKQLPPDSVPTPLTDPQAQAFYRYSKMRQIGKSLSSTRLPDNLWGLQNTDDWKGKYTILYCWYAGCPPCKKIKPAIEDVSSTLIDSADILLISLTYDSIIHYAPDSNYYQVKSAYRPIIEVRDTGMVRGPLVSKVETQWPVVGQFKGILEDWGFLSTPTILVLDKDCKVRHIRTGGPIEATPEILAYYRDAILGMVEWVRKHY